MRLTIGIAGAAFLGLASAAAAQSMPRYAVEAYCQQVADTIGGSAVIYNGCISQEQQAYNKEKARWGSLPARTRSYCDQVAGSIGGSYVILDGCIDQEMSAAGNMGTFKY